MWWLATQIVGYIVLAALLGLLLGYLIFGGRGRRSAADGDGADARIAQLQSELDAANAACDSQEIEIARMRELEAGTAGAEADAALRAELDAMTADRDRLAAELAELKRQGDASATLSADLDRERAAREKAETDLAALAAGSGAAEALRSDLERERAARERAEADLAACREARAALQAELEARTDTVEAAPPPPPPPASLLTERPAEVDDLKRIKGVGPVMEGVLNDKGIYLYRQVANLTASDVAWVNEAIEAFPGRIERDEWVRQAQELYLEKYGRRHDAD